MKELPINGLPSTDAGRHMVRLNIAYRNEIPRYGIANIKNTKNGQSVQTLMLGHDDLNAIYMSFDIRKALGLKTGEKLQFEINRVGIFGKFKWYLQSPDPAIHLPGWLAVISLLLATVGIGLALFT